MDSVLLLNASWEPLRVTRLFRAVVLVMSGKADVVDVVEGKFLRSEKQEIPYPSVIRLKYYVRVPDKSIMPLSKRSILIRDGYRCAYCSRKASTVDHIKPRSRGGEHNWLNVVASCYSCNQVKGNRLLHEIGWKPAISPYAPRSNVWISALSAGREEWAPFLAFKVN